MNAPVRPPAIAPHRFSIDDIETLERTGLFAEHRNIELIDGHVFREGEGCLHRFSVDDVYAMIRAGIIEEGARLELIEGVLIDMASDGPRHRDWTYALGRWLYADLSDEYIPLAGSTLRLADDVAPEPDWYIFSAALATDSVRGHDVFLAIEQSDSSTRRDLGWKADLYARYGVQDYWVIDIEKNALHIHRDPTPEGYGFRQRFGADAEVAALLIPGLTLRLDRLPRVGGSY